MPIFNSPNLAALKTDILAAVTASTGTVTAAITAKSAIKSIQRGTVAMSGAANAQVTQAITIAAVNMSKSFVNVSSSLLGTSTGSQGATGAITATTTLELKAQAGSAGVAVQVSWEVIEYA
jgi:hypothetical protein